MNFNLNIIRGLVRPVVTFIGFAAFTYAFLHNPQISVAYITAVMLMLGFWFGQRKPQNGQ